MALEIWPKIGLSGKIRSSNSYLIQPIMVTVRNFPLDACIQDSF